MIHPPASAAHPDTRTPNSLFPGFARTWPDCQPAMRAITRHLLALDANEAEIIAALKRDFPDLPTPTTASNPDAYYINMVSLETFALQRHPELAHDVLDDHYINEPDEEGLRMVSDVGTLLALLEQYGIHTRLDAETGAISLSQKIDPEGPLWAVLKAYKAELLAAHGWRR
jgi:hypothetical protein